MTNEFKYTQEDMDKMKIEVAGLKDEIQHREEVLYERTKRTLALDLKEAGFKGFTVKEERSHSMNVVTLEFDIGYTYNNGKAKDSD